MDSKNWLVLLAGLPERLSCEFEKKFHKVGLEEIELISVPTSITEKYGPSYIQKIYSRFHNSVQGRFRCHSLESNFQGVIFLYFNHARMDTSSLISAFATETIVVRLSSNDELFDVNIAPNKRNRMINSSMIDIRKAVGVAKNKARVLKKELTSNDNRTPFLLPFKYFKRENLQYLSSEIVDVDYPLVSQGILNLRIKYERAIRQVGFGRSGQQHFVNSQGLVFKSPGRRARHGFPRDLSDSDHEKKCFVRGVLRFGVPYDAKFHYDCENERGGAVPRYWKSCHGQPRILPAGRKHANIAPNEFVR